MMDKIIKLLGGYTLKEYLEKKEYAENIAAENWKKDQQITELEKCKTDAIKLAQDNIKTAEQMQKTIQEEQDLKLYGKIGLYLRDYFQQIPDKAYLNKRKANGKYYTVYLNQMITPDAWEIHNGIKNLILLYPNIKTEREQYIRLGDYIAKDFTWTDDKNLDASGDYYLYPEEILTTKKGDCEDHAYTVASFQPETIGVAYGFYYPNGKDKPTNDRFGHAWNVALIDNQLYHLETTGNVCELIPFYDTTSKYETYFIVTKKGTYSIRAGMDFGYLADNLNDKKTSVKK